MFDPFVFLFELTYTLMVMGLLTVKYKYPTNNHLYLLFHWFSDENCITFTFSSQKG